jgi:EAL domain-containing protein (putative c-di-GMP-specific phosphodiesterase class I)
MAARRVEIEFVGDRLAGARLAQAYGFVVPERRRVTANDRSDDERRDLAGGRADGPGSGDLRAGLLGAPAPGRDDPEPDRRAVRISVNVAASQLRDQAFPDDVARVLAETGLPADQLYLEITESSLIVDVDHGFAGILALRHPGVQLSIDDFGTGYSSLSYLHQMAVDELKIDRSFVGRLDHDSRDRHLVEAIIGMAHALNLTVVAEGVETDEQRELLAQMRCGLGQGYLFAEPLPSARFLDLLDAQPALLGVTG